MMLESIRVTEKLHWPEQELSKKSVLNPEEHKLTIKNESSLQRLSSGILKDIFTTGTSSYNVLLQSKEEKKHQSQKLSSAHHKRHKKCTKSSTTSRSNEHRKIKVPLPLLSSGWYCTNRQPSIFIASPVSSSVKFTHSISVAGNSIGLPPRPKSKAKRHYFSSLTKPKQPQLSKSHGKEVDVSGRKLCILTAIKPSNVEKEKIKFFKSDFTYNPQFEYANPALPNVLAKHSQASNKFLKQSVSIMERTLQKYGSYEKFEQATGGSLLPKSRIWNHVRKYMVKEGCLGEIVVHLTEDLLSRASMTVVNGRPTLTINVSTAREHWLEGMLRHEIGCFSKDQVYLDGILQILRYRESIDFHLLMALGKVSYEDVDRLKEFAVMENMRVPHFLQDHIRYMEHLEKIMEVNELTDQELQDLIV
ncbi:putative tyrosine carboxypeptidase MATCAP2 isoform X2 [Gopherus flavomarginatus]|uniref:putative tyrosine carboxypeptidase MATCAP2 isoform X2 n=1 Tax=Gopherus flavomarginatus TaxID=286002 RepID=UPI0021CBC9A6|nr:putative tyrosine carboxypeptidase MATCAP2 isoform X2 [Gopherus flavomarginatus]